MLSLPTLTASFGIIQMIRLCKASLVGVWHQGCVIYDQTWGFEWNMFCHRKRDVFLSKVLLTVPTILTSVTSCEGGFKELNLKMSKLRSLLKNDSLSKLPVLWWCLLVFFEQDSMPHEKCAAIAEKRTFTYLYYMVLFFNQVLQRVTDMLEEHVIYIFRV
jgi:hypothetical protein